MNKSTIYFLLQFVFFFKDVVTLNTSSTFQKEEKISGGDPAIIQFSPYNAYLNFPDENNQRCGGSIISNNVILTSANCIVGAILVQIRIGSSNTDRGGTVYTSDSLIAHPLFDPRDDNGDFDIGLIRVEEGMMLNGFTARPIKLADLGSDPQEGIAILITGWGLTDEYSDEYSDILYVANVPVINRDRCSDLIGKMITMNMFCASTDFDGTEDSETEDSQPGACMGDFGGPGVDSGTAKLAGVISYSDACGDQFHTTVFTRIGAASIRMFIMAMAGV